MKKSAILLAAVVAMCLVFTATAFAQGAKTGWSIGIPGGMDAEKLLDSPAIETVSGTVVKTEVMRGVKDGLQMRLKADDGAKWVVYLGPKWFVGNQRIKFMPKDKVEVRGAKIVSEGDFRIVASEVSKGEWTMKLRNEDDGMPNWECCVPRAERDE